MLISKSLEEYVCVFPLQNSQLTNEQPTPIQHFTIVSAGTCGLPVESLLQLDHHVEDLKQLL